MPSRTRHRFADLLSGLPPMRGLLPLILGLALWQALDPQRSPYFPPPSAWWDSVRVMIQNGKLAPALASTLVTFLLAMAIAGIIGGALGIMIGRSRQARRALGPLFEFCRRLAAAGDRARGGAAARLRRKPQAAGRGLGGDLADPDEHRLGREPARRVTDRRGAHVPSRSHDNLRQDHPAGRGPRLPSRACASPCLSASSSHCWWRC